METITDLLTGVKFNPSRINQRFQTPANRIQYYNRKAKKIRLMKSQYDKPLHKNYLILTELLEGKNEVVYHKQYLLGKGYHLGVYTHLKEYNGKNCFAIYEFLIVTNNSDDIKFIRTND